MNKKQLAILSMGNVLSKDEGIALYASKYLELNYSFNPSIDIIHGDVEGMNLLNIFIQYNEVIILDVIGIDDSPGSIYNFPMQKFRSLSTNDNNDDMDVLGCLNVLESRGESLPNVSLLAIVPDCMDNEISLSPILHHSFDAYILNLVKALESKGFSYEEKEQKQMLDSVIESFVNRDLA